LNDSGVDVQKYDLLRVTGTGISGAYFTVSKALAGTEPGAILVADHDIPSGDTGIARRTYLLSANTAGQPKGTLVYAASLVANAGKITFTPNEEPVGWVGISDAEGWVVVSRSDIRTTTSEFLAAAILLNQSFTAASTLTAAAGGNTYPQDLFAGESKTTLAAPETSKYKAKISGYCNTDVAVGAGAFLANAILVDFTVNGTPLGSPSLVMPDFTRNPSPLAHFTHEAGMSLLKGDAVGVVFGFLGGVQPQSINMYAPRTISLSVSDF
tara:strand:- start:4053 stop:4856 length:804 start_codon:yes stop_codon:yes gene_type:complete